MTKALDPAQLSAATGSGRYQLVLAGPGSGKTTTLAGRFVHLVQNRADRRRIFPKKAVNEMKARIIAALGLPSARDLTSPRLTASRFARRSFPSRQSANWSFRPLLARNSHHALASVIARQQANQCLGRIFQALDHVLLNFELACLDPTS